MEELIDYTVICHTMGCPNFEKGIVAPSLRDAPSFQCGPCRIDITDITPLE